MIPTIQRVTLLHGHTDPDSAYVKDDYPYGSLRCTIRFWIETAVKGAKKGQQRFMRQTTNPKRDNVWNKPHPSTYYQMAVLYLDERGHVQFTGIGTWLGPEDDARWRHMGIVDQLTAEQEKVYRFLRAFSEKVNPTTWTEWTDHVTALAEHLAEHGAEPEFERSTWTDTRGRLRYASNPSALLADARAQLGG